jgi:hypothetical protein
MHFDVKKNNILNRKAGPSESESIEMPAALRLTDTHLARGKGCLYACKGNVVVPAVY